MRDREKKIWDDQPLDSDEEYLFLCWYEEAESLGLVGNLVRQPEFELSPRQSVEIYAPTKRNPGKMKEKFLFHPHSYKADFSFEVLMGVDPKGNNVPALNKLATDPNKGLRHAVVDGRYVCVVDIKGGFANHRSRNSSDVTFPLNQKWVYHRYKIYVNKLEITPKKGFFRNFWAPDEAFITAKGNDSIRYKSCCRFSDVKNLINKEGAL